MLVICDNCGAHIDDQERYCPECGMELLVSDYKPLKKKYMGGEYRYKEYKSYRPSYHEEEIEELEEEYGYDEESQGSILPYIVLLLLIALIFGLILGIIVFSGGLENILPV